MYQLTITERFKRSFKKHPVTMTIMTINTLFMIATYIVNAYAFKSLVVEPATLVFLGGLVPSFISGQHEYYRLITPIFLHGGLIHFLMNSYFLFIMGRFVEDLLGKRNYIIIYILSGLGSSLLVWGAYVIGIGNNTVTIGASGALFGLMGALLLLTYKKPLLFAPQAMRSIRTLVIINVAITLYSALYGGNISLWGHLGGLLSGVIIMFLLLVNYQGPEKKKPNDDHNSHYGNYIIDADDISDDDIYYKN